MIFEAREYIVKSGKKVIVKTPSPNEADKVLGFIKNTASESNFLLKSPGDLKITVEEEKEFIASFDENSGYFLCVYLNGEIIADCNLSFNRHLKCRHRGDIGIAVRKEYWGQGVGSILFEIMIELAKNKEGIEQLTLECLDTNERGLRLYKKYGFIETGRRPKYIKQIDGSYNDEIVMTKFLED